jgi:hypothetical protein
MEIATVIAPYTATSKEQLSLAQVSFRSESVRM